MPNTNDNHNSSKSHTESAYRHMLSGGFVTGAYAYSKWGCSRLAARILDIEKRYGIRPARQTIKVGVKRVKQYWIEREANS